MTRILDAKNWKYAALPTIFLVLLAVYPQLNFWVTKESAWNGAYFVANFDEVAYSAYVNALIDGKPRKYDQYMAAETPHESLYSIQFIPAYTIAIPARLLGLDATQAFILLNILCAALAALCIFWLLFQITGDAALSGAGVLVICCFGTAIAYEGELRYWFEDRILVDFFPFLRRYQPGFAFPFFFFFVTSVWLALRSETRKSAVLYSLLSGLLFAFLVFSYFFLWTAAAAWLACIFVLYVVWRRENLQILLTSCGIIVAFAIAALIPYNQMLSERGAHIDSVQLLTNTHLPDLDSPSMIIAILIAIGIAAFVFRGGAKITSPRTLFALAFAVTPLVLFNQQIITGQSLQPVHYELFIANYMALTALVLFLSMVLENAPKSAASSAVISLAIIAGGWGIIEATGSTERNRPFAELRDSAIPAIRHMEEEERRLPSGRTPPTVFASNTGWADFIPTIGSFRPLWSSHSTSAGGIDIAENKRLFYCYLYYAGFSERDVANQLRAGSFEMIATLLGSERALPDLGRKTAPITHQEIASEARAYGDFARNFAIGSASDPTLSYAVVSSADDTDFSNLDRWYERDAGTVTGELKVYKVKLRQETTLSRSDTFR
jgi:hypothetical protein